MIAQLKGTVTFSDGQQIILLTSSGVGYEIVFHDSVEDGMEIFLFISHMIKENGQKLYGFKSLAHKKLFEQLIQVNGVGPKLAYTTLSRLGMETLLQAISMEDKKLLVRAPGVGPKLASQIILDLKNKFKKENFLQIIALETDNMAALETNSHLNLLEESLMALEALGFKKDKMLPLVKKILKEENLSSAEGLIAKALKEI